YPRLMERSRRFVIFYKTILQAYYGRRIVRFDNETPADLGMGINPNVGTKSKWAKPNIKNERPKQTGQLYKTLWVNSPIEAKTVEKENATSHHVSDRHTIREHASRPEPSPSPERLRRRSAISRDNSVKNHPCREASHKQNATESSIQKRYHRLQSIHLIPMKRQKPAKRVLRKPPLPRSKRRTIIEGCNAGGKAGRKNRNWKPKNKNYQTLSSS
ncbi:hypothetical protein HID58_034645, partial [Brassica napus]